MLQVLSDGDITKLLQVKKTDVYTAYLTFYIKRVKLLNSQIDLLNSLTDTIAQDNQTK